MGGDKIGRPGGPPNLRVIRGGKRCEGKGDCRSDRVQISGDEAADDPVRPGKVAEARLKILNGYYARRDIQMRLAERLILELEF